jgi:hypothetical protein
MPAAGYSKRPLSEKLGIKPEWNAVVLNAPKHYPSLLEGAFPNLRFALRGKEQLPFVHLFATEPSDISKILPKIKEKLLPNGMVWISWPKKTSGVQTPLDEHIVRKLGLEGGLVDVKVCAVDETWSGLKFVIRLKDRP